MNRDLQILSVFISIEQRASQDGAVTRDRIVVLRGVGAKTGSVDAGQNELEIAPRFNFRGRHKSSHASSLISSAFESIGLKQ